MNVPRRLGTGFLTCHANRRKGCPLVLTLPVVLLEPDLMGEMPVAAQAMPRASEGSLASATNPKV